MYVQWKQRYFALAKLCTYNISYALLHISTTTTHTLTLPFILRYYRSLTDDFVWLMIVMGRESG